MKTKDLIAALQKEDPSGEIEVIADGDPIYSINKEPAYYDGPLKVLVQDYSLDPYYNIVGFKYVRGGFKIRISTMGLRDCLCDDADLPVDTSELSGPQRDIIEERISKIRLEMKAIDERIANEKKIDPPTT